MKRNTPAKLYVVVDIADRYYEEDVGVKFNNYNDTLNFLKTNNLLNLIDKLNYLEHETNLDICVVSYI